MKLTRLVPVAALVALVGCSPSPTTAADVEGTIISEDVLSQAVDGCAELGIELPRNEMLRTLVIGQVVRSVAENNGVSMDQERIDRAAAGDPEIMHLMGNDGCAKAVETNVLLGLVAEDIEEAKFMEEVMDLEVEVNPRYGDWDPEQATVGGSGSLSVPENPEMLGN